MEPTGGLDITHVEFRGFQKIARLRREMIITEKIDGTNAQIFITDTGEIHAGSRKRWITPQDDNFGFARWVAEHEQELLAGLGPGQHFGEWWGQGIQRGYDLKEKRFSLFNVSRWSKFEADPLNDGPDQCPECCDVVPTLYRGLFDTNSIATALTVLKNKGSYAAPGFLKPEGLVIYHVHSGQLFKRTIENDDVPKGAQGK
jgi:hypothetical protein